VPGFLDLRERLLTLGPRVYNGSQVESLFVILLGSRDIPFLRKFIEELHIDINRAGEGGVTAMGCVAVLKYYEAVGYTPAIPRRTLEKLHTFRGWEVFRWKCGLPSDRRWLACSGIGERFRRGFPTNKPISAQPGNWFLEMLAVVLWKTVNLTFSKLSRSI
jgi:hypothetical protein